MLGPTCHLTLLSSHLRPGPLTLAASVTFPFLKHAKALPTSGPLHQLSCSLSLEDSPPACSPHPTPQHTLDLQPAANFHHLRVRAHVDLLLGGAFPDNSAQSPHWSPPATPVSTPPSASPTLYLFFTPSLPHSLSLGSNQDSDFAFSYFSLVS